VRDRSRLSQQLRQRIQTALGSPSDGQVPVLLAPAGAGLAPVLHDEIAIQKFVEADCGADGFAIKDGKLIAVRWRDGAAFPIKTYEVDAYGK
jgi:hypothetical protein